MRDACAVFIFTWLVMTLAFTFYMIGKSGPKHNPEYILSDGTEYRGIVHEK